MVGVCYDRVASYVSCMPASKTAVVMCAIYESAGYAYVPSHISISPIYAYGQPVYSYGLSHTCMHADIVGNPTAVACFSHMRMSARTSVGISDHKHIDS